MKRPINPCVKCAEKCTGKCDSRVTYEQKDKVYRQFIKENKEMLKRK